MVDWRALQRWHIHEHLLPAGCVVRYRPVSLWQEHKVTILVALGVFLAQALTIAGLLVQRTMRHRAEAEIQNQRAALAHASRLSTMGQMSSALAHELNQPLGAILRNAEAAEILIQRETPDLGELREILSDIRKDDQRAGAVIDRMRSLLKRKTLAASPLEMRGLLEETIALARPDAAARHLTLILEAAPRLGTVRGDRVQLQQVLLNLILNGMDAVSELPESDRTVVVQSWPGSNGHLEVAVSDSGAGIPPDKLKMLFEPFYTTKVNGMGMGLAISRTIIEAHGGKIRAENNGGKGAIFTFSLPIAKAE
jgi:C4-dicarboxylate-specific signal transduction histidine kinase